MPQAKQYVNPSEVDPSTIRYVDPSEVDPSTIQLRQPKPVSYREAVASPVSDEEYNKALREELGAFGGAVGQTLLSAFDPRTYYQLWRLATQTGKVGQEASQAFKDWWQSPETIGTQTYKNKADAISKIGWYDYLLTHAPGFTGTALGTVYGSALLGELPGKAVKAYRGKLPERMYKSILKPGPASYTIPQRLKLVRTAISEGIPVSEEGFDKLWKLITDLNNKVKAKIASGATLTVDPYDVATRTQQLGQKFALQVNPRSDLQAIQEATDEFLASRGEIRDARGNVIRRAQPMTVQEAQDIKTGTYQRLSKKYGELKGGQIEAQKALARGIKEELERHFPEIKDLNMRESRLINLDEALQRAVNRIGNRNMLPLGATIVATGAGTAASAALGSAHGAEAFVVTGTLYAVLTDPVVQSKLAIALSRAGTGMAPHAAAARVAGYTAALGNAASLARESSQQSSPQGSEQ